MYETNPLKLTNMDVIKSISLRLVLIGKYEENLSMPQWAVSKVFTSFYFFLPGYPQLGLPG